MYVCIYVIDLHLRLFYAKDLFAYDVTYHVSGTEMLMDRIVGPKWAYYCFRKSLFMCYGYFYYFYTQLQVLRL